MSPYQQYLHLLPAWQWLTRLRPASILLLFALGSLATGSEVRNLFPHVADSDPSQQDQDINWRTGADFQKQLQSKTQINWSGTSLRSALSSLAENQRIAIFLDRRVDPDQTIEFASGDGTLEAALDRLTDQLQLTHYAVGNLIYIADPADLDAVVTGIEAHKSQLSGPLRTQRSIWMQPTQLTWEMLSEPRSILKQMATADEPTGPILQGLENVPHDLWAAADWPPLSRIEAVSLLLGGFDLGVALHDDGTAAIEPLSHQEQIERVYRVPANRSVNVLELREQFPGAKIEAQANRLTVAGSMLTHRALDDLLKGSPRGQSLRNNPNRTEEKVYTIRNTTTAAGNVVATVAKQLKVEMRTEGAAAEKLKAQITIDVSDVGIDELLREVLDPLELNYQLTQEHLIIRPK